jgi:N-methylhydantoinase A/oxoprolinase/acetone carboxylase beta subunit
MAKLAPMTPAKGDPRAGEQRAYFKETGEVALRRYHRDRLVPGRTVRGPALIEDEWSTTLVEPGQRCAADRYSNLLLESGV